MNQMMGSASTSMSTYSIVVVDISPPKVEVIEFDEQSRTEYVPDGEELIAISFNLFR